MRPELVQMESSDADGAPDRAAVQNSSDTATQAHLDRLAQQQQRAGGTFCLGLSFRDFFTIIASFGLLTAYLLFMMQDVQHSVEYLSMTCFVLPNLLFAYMLATRHGSSKPLPVAGIILRFVIAFVVLLPLIFLLATLLLVVMVFIVSIFHPGVAAQDALRVIIVTVVVVISEEVVKLLIYTFKDQRASMQARPEFYIYFGLSTALGVACSEIFIIVRELTKVMDAGAEKELERQNGVPQVGEVMLLLVLLTFMMVPMQLLASYMIGLACARVLQKQSVKEVILPLLIAILFRTLFYVCVFTVFISYSFWMGGASCFALFLTFTVVVLQYQQGMPAEYLRKTGYISVGGFVALASDEEGAAEAEAEQAAPDNSNNQQRPQNVSETNNTISATTAAIHVHNSSASSTGTGAVDDASQQHRFGGTDHTVTEVPAVTAAVREAMNNISVADLKALSPAQSDQEDDAYH